jgi:hypothetical protein
LFDNSITVDDKNKSVCKYGGRMKIEIICEKELATEDEVRESLGADIHGNNAGAYKQESGVSPPKKMRFRGADPTFLIAVVGASGTLLGTIITGLFQLINSRRGNIVIQTKNGYRLEIPNGTSTKQLNEVIQAIIALENETLSVVLSKELKDNEQGLP